MIRAGNLSDRSVMYRHDLNFGNDGVPQDPHLFPNQLQGPPAYARMARGSQEQMAAFFLGDGARVPPPSPPELWEAPMKTLPEDLFLLPRPR